MTGTNHDALKQRHRTLREGYPPNLNLRVHRALSWLKRAEMADDDDGALQSFCGLLSTLPMPARLTSVTGYRSRRRS